MNRDAQLGCIAEVSLDTRDGEGGCWIRVLLLCLGGPRKPCNPFGFCGRASLCRIPDVNEDKSRLGERQKCPSSIARPSFSDQALVSGGI